MGSSAAQLTGEGEGEENKIQEKMERKRKKGRKGGGGGRRPWEEGDGTRGGIKGIDERRGEQGRGREKRRRTTE